MTLVLKWLSKYLYFSEGVWTIFGGFIIGAVNIIFLACEKMGKFVWYAVVQSNLVILCLRLISYVKLYIGFLVPTAMPDDVKTVGTKAKDLRTNTGNNEAPTSKKLKLVSHSSTFLSNTLGILAFNPPHIWEEYRKKQVQWQVPRQKQIQRHILYLRTYSLIIDMFCMYLLYLLHRQLMRKS